MFCIILHSKEVAASREFVAANPDQQHIDWFDLDVRKILLKLTGDLNVQGAPSVLLEAPAWFKPEEFYGDVRVDYPASFETLFEPESWGAVEERINFLNARTKGYTDEVEIPDCEVIIWGSVPEPPKEKTSIFDGWDIQDGVARRRWRFVDAPPPKPSVEVLGDE